jgi:putative redox protein
MVEVSWKGGMVFEALPPTGNIFTMDAHPELGGDHRGPTPVETLLGAIAACSAMDVVAILQKKRQVITGYRIEVEGVRGPEGQYPRPFLSLTVNHILSGTGPNGGPLDPVAVARAVELSDGKYCSVIATLRSSPEVQSKWTIE